MIFVKNSKIIIDGILIGEKYGFALFYKHKKLDDVFKIELTNDYNKHSYKSIFKKKCIEINYNPLWRKIKKIQKEKNVFKIENEKVQVFNSEGNLNLILSLNSKNFKNENFELIENNSFGNRIKNKIIKYEYKKNKYSIKMEQKLEIKYGILGEIIKKKNTIYECVGDDFYEDKFKFIIVDVINGDIGVKKWNGRIFKNRIDFSFSPDKFIKNYKIGNIKIYRL